MLYKTLNSFWILNHYQEDTLIEKKIFQFHFRDDTNDGSYLNTWRKSANYRKTNIKLSKAGRFRGNYWLQRSFESYPIASYLSITDSNVTTNGRQTVHTTESN